MAPDGEEMQERFYMEFPEEWKTGVLGSEGGAKVLGVRTFTYHEVRFLSTSTGVVEE